MVVAHCRILGLDTLDFVAAHYRTRGLDTLDSVAERYRSWGHDNLVLAARNRCSLESVVNSNRTRPGGQTTAGLPTRDFQSSPAGGQLWISSLRWDPVNLALASCAPGYRC